jgi:small-conductance mechanosensitive channel
MLRSDSLYDQLSNLSPRTLQNLSQEWSLYLRTLNEWEKALLSRSQVLERQKKLLQNMAVEWKITADSTKSEETPEAIRERIASIVIEIDTVETNLAERINTLLVLQNRISEQQIAINELISLINNTEAQLQTRLFVQDSPPLWEAFQAQDDTLHVGGRIGESWKNFSQTMIGFARANEKSLYLHLFLFAGLLVLMVYFYRRNKQQRLFDEGEEVLKASAFFISRPFSAALLIALFFSIWLYPDATVTMAELVIISFLIPLLRLMSGVVVKERRKAVYAMAMLYVFIFFHNNVVGHPLLQRLLLIAITIAAIGLFARLIRSVRPIQKQQLRPWPKLIFRLLPLGLLILLLSLSANIYGSVAFAYVITEGVIKSIIVAIILYTIARVIDGLVVLLIRKRAARGLQFVKAYAPQMERWAVIIVHMVAFLIWIRATLRGFRLFQPLQTWFREILSTQWTFGTVTVSVQSIFDFLLILIFALVISRLIRIFLDLEVFPRVRLPRGIPGAISMVIRYTVIGVGIFLAISTLGLDLGKFGLLAGALGVGLGFGLQNVIANFVSGLILVFERPIQVGDKVEVGTVLGNVKQIGVRSSTVQTFDGSEVIVPNADLISHQVTNWTLSDSRQRMKLPVKVAFDTEPEEVLEILLKIAREHPGVLDEPKPVATFNGFGDYFLDFTLYYWISENIFQIKTEVALAVHRRIKEAGIEKPRPQQDIQLKIIDNPDKKRTSGKKKDGDE